MTSPDRDTPDTDAARQQLTEVRDRRTQVDRLVARLMRERRLNSFTANMNVVLKGRQ